MTRIQVFLCCLWSGLCLLGLAACNPSAPVTPVRGATASAPAALSVELVHAVRRSVPEWLEVSGNVAARETVSVSTELGGLRIARFHADVGQAVQAGQLLATLDDALLRSELAQLQAAADEAGIAVEAAQAQGRRAQELAAQGMVSQQALQNAQSAEGAAQARWRSQQAALGGVRQRLSRTRLVAPVAGVITARQGVQGSVVAPGQDVFRLTRQAELEWQAEVPASDVHRLQTGALVQLQTDGGEALTGTVTRIDPVVDPGSRRVLVHVALPTVDGVRPGHYLKGRLSIGERDAWWVPSTAVILRGDRALVLSVDAQNLVHEQPVQVLRTEGRETAVQGVDEGLSLVAQGAPYLSQGDRVQVLGWASVTAPPAPAAQPASGLRGLSLEP